MYVKSYVHDEVVAEDIVTESLIHLWEEMKERSVDPIAPFLFKILKNHSIDYLRHEKMKQKAHENIREILNREIEIRLYSIEISDPSVIFSNEIKQIVEKSLVSLPNKTKEIFIMNRFENKSHKEIAEKLEISVKGVEYHITQAIRVLRYNLKDYLMLFFFLVVHRS